MKGTIALLVLALVAGCSKEESSSVAREPMPEVLSAPPEFTPTPPPPQMPFDVTASTLDGHFKGNDCKRISDAVSSLDVERSQYESSKDYKSRIDSIKENKYLDELKLNSVIAFVDDKSGSFTYDADKGLLNYWAGPPGYNITASNSSPMLTMSKDTLNQEKYLASNAYGASTEVDYKKEHVCVVTFKNLKFEGLDKPRVLAIKMPADAARRLEGLLKTVYIGNLMPPYAGQYEEFRDATYTDPHKLYITGRNLPLRLQQVWIINQATGEVIHKRKVG